MASDEQRTYFAPSVPRPSPLILPPDLRGWEWRYLWKQCQGNQRFILAEHTYGASAVGMLADRKTVFSAGNDKFVRLWDFESRRPIGMLPHSAAIGGAAASPDGRWLATASYNGTEANLFYFGTWSHKRPPLSPLTSGTSTVASPFHRTASGSLSRPGPPVAFVYGM